MRVLDGVVIVLCAVGGVQPQTGTVWKQANRYEVPRLIFVNKMDRSGADFFKVVKSVKESLPGLHSTWTNAHPVQLPIGAENDFVGVVDLLERKSYIFAEDDPMGKKIEERPIPEEMAEISETYRKQLEEAIVEANDNLMEKYLEGATEFTFEE